MRSDFVIPDWLIETHIFIQGDAHFSIGTETYVGAYHRSENFLRDSLAEEIRGFLSV